MRNSVPFWLIGASYAMVAYQGASASEIPRLVDAPIEKVFIPLGFDHNDDAEIIVHGHFPNNCFKVGPISKTIDHDKKRIDIVSQAFFYDGTPCAQMNVPFIQSVKLGTLEAGNYSINLPSRPNLEAGTLRVKRSTHEGADDYLYAPVSEARLTKEDSRTQLNVSGTYPHMFVGCMVLKTVKTYVSEGNVLVAQPIAEIKPDDECHGSPREFSVSTDITDELQSGEYLLHVRALAGDSLNRLVDLP